MAELSTCPGCGRHCSIDRLHCRRGEQIVANLKAKQTESIGNNDKTTVSEKSPSPSVQIPEIDQKLIAKLSSTGSALRVLKENKKDTELISVFKGLSQLEKESLLSQLDKLTIPESKESRKPVEHRSHSHHHKYHHKHRKHRH